MSLYRKSAEWFGSAMELLMVLFAVLVVGVLVFGLFAEVILPMFR